MSYRILLVDPDSSTALASEEALVRSGYRVAPVSTFEEATRSVSLECPDLLVTRVRLGAFNGLHLLLRCRAEHPDVPVIIVGASADRSADMTRFGAEFVTTPIERAPFLELVATLLAGRTPYGPVGARGLRRPTTPLELAGPPDATQVSVVTWLPSPGSSSSPVSCIRTEMALHTARHWHWATGRWRGMIDSLN
jgi:DNA-binding response OmpR family regulator